MIERTALSGANDLRLASGRRIAGHGRAVRPAPPILLVACLCACSAPRPAPPASESPPPPVAPPADSITLTATGMAAVPEGGDVSKARDAALRGAKRNAVEQGLGSLVSSATLTQNFQLVSDRIYSASDGYVARYDLLGEGVDAASGMYRVTIRAEVNRRRLEDDVASLKLFQQETGYRRVMVVLRQEAGGVARGEGPDESALAKVGDVLREKQFRVFEQEALGTVYDKIRAAGGGTNDEELSRAALDQGAEIYVALRLSGGRKPATGEERFSGAYATVKLKAYDCTTGRLLGAAEEKGKRIVRRTPSEHDWRQGIGEAAAEAAEKATEVIVPKLVATVRADEETGTPYQLVFQGLTEDEFDAVLDAIEQDPSFKARRVLHKRPGYGEVEVFSDERDTERLGRHLRTEMKKQGVALETRDLAGSRITFGGAGGGDR